MIVLADSTKTLPLADESVQCVVTSPPYWGLRDYGIAGQLGLEATPEEYVSELVAVFHEVRRVLKDDGTVWLNLGDSYAGSGKGPEGGLYKGMTFRHLEYKSGKIIPNGLKPKDLIGIPWRVAFALQAGGWYLRTDIIWSKPNPMPESVTDRPTRAHEYLFLLTKSARYFYDADAIKEPVSESQIGRIRSDQIGGKNGHTVRHSPGAVYDTRKDKQRGHSRRHAGFNERWDTRTAREQAELTNELGGRNKRSVWTIAPQPYPGAHFATFPEKLVEPCVLAGSRAGDVVLDPFGGTGTVEVVAARHGRRAVCLELNPAYAAQARDRTGRPIQRMIV